MQRTRYTCGFTHRRDKNTKHPKVWCLQLKTWRAASVICYIRVLSFKLCRGENCRSGMLWPNISVVWCKRLRFYPKIKYSVMINTVINNIECSENTFLKCSFILCELVNTQLLHSLKKWAPLMHYLTEYSARPWPGHLRETRCERIGIQKKKKRKKNQLPMPRTPDPNPVCGHRR